MSGERWTSDMDEKMLFLLSEGLSRAEIGEQLGRTSRTISRRLQTLGKVKPRQPGVNKRSTDEMHTDPFNRMIRNGSAQLLSAMIAAGYGRREAA